MTELDQGEIDRHLLALESIADSLIKLDGAIETAVNRIELKLIDLGRIIDMGLTSIEMTITRGRQT